MAIGSKNIVFFLSKFSSETFSRKFSYFSKGPPFANPIIGPLLSPNLIELIIVSEFFLENGDPYAISVIILGDKYYYDIHMGHQYFYVTEELRNKFIE